MAKNKKYKNNWQQRNNQPFQNNTVNPTSNEGYAYNTKTGPKPCPQCGMIFNNLKQHVHEKHNHPVEVS
jgi:hypothetical protein